MPNPFDGSDGPRVAIFADCTDTSMPIVNLAQAAEARGFTGLFLNEHPHLPVQHPRSEFPGGGEIPERYARFWDPFVALSFVAATTGLEIGTNISLVGEHDPIALAKAVATLDVLSGGRLVLGVGFGWHREEFEDHGRPANVRAKVVEEHVRLMRVLWTEEVGAFEGEYVRVSPSRSWPKPMQRPHPPVLLGVRASARNFDRITSWADGWVPMGTPEFAGGVFADQVRELRAGWAEAGRPPEALHLQVQLSGRPFFELAELADQAYELGAGRVLVRVGDLAANAALNRLDALAEAFAGRFG
jgi:probable F420-dependent oxidoreductase